MRLEIVAYKLPEGIWAFDHDHEDTVCEALLNGTELVIDAHYKRIKGVNAVEDDRLKIVLATEPQDDLGDPDTELDKDDGDHYLLRARTRDACLALPLA